MKSYGIEGKASQHTESFMSGREQSVHLNETRARLLPVKKGIAHGSLFGSLGFLILMNDLHTSCAGEISVLADDTSVTYICESDPQYHLNY